MKLVFGKVAEENGLAKKSTTPVPAKMYGSLVGLVVTLMKSTPDVAGTLRSIEKPPISTAEASGLEMNTSKKLLVPGAATESWTSTIRSANAEGAPIENRRKSDVVAAHLVTSRPIMTFSFAADDKIDASHGLGGILPPRRDASQTKSHPIRPIQGECPPLAAGDESN
jgi:hypothetical protein